MDRYKILKEMRETIGTQEPIKFFEKMVDVLDVLFDHIEELEADVKRTRLQSALSIQWEPKMASTMLSQMINDLREDKENYVEEISQLKKAFVEDKVTQNYQDFCRFWEEVLGWHPFLDYEK